MNSIKTVLLTGTILIVTGCNWTGLASVNSSGDQGEFGSSNPSLSSNGRFTAFDSFATNMVVDDTNEFKDIFVRDTLNGITSRVSKDSTGAEGNGNSAAPSISSDGRYVAFESDASNLVAGDTNNCIDVFVHDRTTSTTTRVSVDNAGLEGNNWSFAPSISGDGRYVAFETRASNLGDGNIIVHDLTTGTNSVASVTSAGVGSAGYSPSISGDGRYVAFYSNSNIMVAEKTNTEYDIFVRDLTANTTTRVSVDSAGLESDNSSFDPFISSDGRYVAFYSHANNLVADDFDNFTDIYVHDRNTGTTTRVTVDSPGGGGEEDYNNYEAAISGDGRYVAFFSASNNQVQGDTNNSGDVFVHDRNTGTTTRVSVDSAGVEGNGWSSGTSISADGRYVAFQTSSTNLVPNDMNGKRDIVIRAIPEVTITSVVPDQLPIDATTPITITGTNFLPGATAYTAGGIIENIVVVDENTMTLNVTVPTGTPAGDQTVLVHLPGTGPGPTAGSVGDCLDCVTIMPPGC